MGADLFWFGSAGVLGKIKCFIPFKNLKYVVWIIKYINMIK